MNRVEPVLYLNRCRRDAQIITYGETAILTGKVEQGKIVADDGKEYLVADNAQSKELMSKHMCHQVQVMGTVTEKDGKNTITISSFKHLA